MHYSSFITKVIKILKKMNKIVADVISLSGPLFFLWLLGSLVYTAMEMKSNHNTRKLSIIPYLAVLTNCVVWSAYGRMEQELPVLAANLIGILVGIYCTSIYHLYSIYPPLPIYYTMTAVIIICTLLLSVLGLINLVGFIAMLLAISVYASPLSTLQIVLQERSTRSMPFFTSLAAWLTSFAWALYGGIIARDLMVLLPSIIGILLAYVQLLMYVLYRFDTASVHYTELRR